jgi:hypothetical protein
MTDDGEHEHGKLPLIDPSVPTGSTMMPVLE